MKPIPTSSNQVKHTASMARDLPGRSHELRQFCLISTIRLRVLQSFAGIGFNPWLEPRGLPTRTKGTEPTSRRQTQLRASVLGLSAAFAQGLEYMDYLLRHHLIDHCGCYIDSRISDPWLHLSTYLTTGTQGPMAPMDPAPHRCHLGYQPSSHGTP